MLHCGVEDESGEDVRCLVVEEPVVGLRQQPARLVVEAAVAGAGAVASEGAAGHGRRPEVVDPAAPRYGAAARGTSDGSQGIGLPAVLVMTPVLAPADVGDDP